MQHYYIVTLREGTHLAQARRLEDVQAHYTGQDVVSIMEATDHEIDVMADAHMPFVKIMDGSDARREVWQAQEAQRKQKIENENRDHCRRIAEDVDAYAAGNVRRCPECGEEITREWDSVGDKFKCPECGTVTDPDEWEPLSIWDYLGDDVYNIEFRLNSHKELASVQIMVACGGPNIYLDTATKNVELYWWTDRASYPLSYKAVEALDDWAEEHWGCL